MHCCATGFQFMGAHFTNMVAFCKYGNSDVLWPHHWILYQHEVTNCREGSSTAQILYIAVYKVYYRVSVRQCDRKKFRVQFAWAKSESSRTPCVFWRESLRFNFKQEVWIHLSKKNIVQPCISFPCSTFTNRRNYNRETKNNFIEPTRLKVFSKIRTSKDRWRFVF